jgi:hypothetical protein
VSGGAKWVGREMIDRAKGGVAKWVMERGEWRSKVGGERNDW